MGKILHYGGLLHHGEDTLSRLRYSIMVTISIIVRKTGQRKCNAAGHLVSPVKKQRDE